MLDETRRCSRRVRIGRGNTRQNEMQARHYVYRVDHDLGFAPHVSRGVCTVCGCKTTTVERWAAPGSWIVGIGGVGTGRRDTLVYAMQVAQTPSYFAFRRSNPRLAAYLEGTGIDPEAVVLVSRTFYYFGNRSPAIPLELRHIIHPTQGCKRLSDEDIALLRRLVLDRYSVGAHGRPNNHDFTGGRPCRTDCLRRPQDRQPEDVLSATRSAELRQGKRTSTSGRRHQAEAAEGRRAATRCSTHACTSASIQPTA